VVPTEKAAVEEILHQFKIGERRSHPSFLGSVLMRESRVDRAPFLSGGISAGPRFLQFRIEEPQSSLTAFAARLMECFRN